MGTRVLEKLGLCMQYSWLLPHLSNRVAERPYKFMLSYGDYLCQLFLCQKQFFLMLLLCLKCPAYAYLLGSTFFLPSLPLALHLRHITSVLPLKIEDFLMPSLSCHIFKCLLPPLNLSVHRAVNAGASYRCAGLTGQSAENTGCYGIKLSSTGACCH